MFRSKGLVKAATLMSECFRRGGKVMTFGVGSNTVNALYLGMELSGRLDNDINLLPCVSLSANPGIVTEVAFKYGLNELFSEQIKTLGRPQDLVVAFSVDGEGQYLINAFRDSKKMGCTNILICGHNDFVWNQFVDSIVVPSAHLQNRTRIHEWQVYVIHNLCWRVRRDLNGDTAPSD